MVDVPDRGRAIWLTFDPQAGHEQAGRRPVVVLSPAAYNQRIGLLLAGPVTNQAKGYPFEVPLPPQAAVSGVVLCDQVKSTDWHARQAAFICELPEATVADVVAKLETLLPVE
jgi:mRNA interferase MazF